MCAKVGGWWQQAKKDASLKIVPFSTDASSSSSFPSSLASASATVPAVVNGRPLTKPAHLSDFRRFQVLYEQGGIYLDTDHILLRSVDPLLKYRSVWGRQGENEKGHQVAIGCILTAPKNPIVKEMLEKMAKVYDGGWATHSIEMVDKYFKGLMSGTSSSRKVKEVASLAALAKEPPGAAKYNLILGYPAMFPFSWKRSDLYGGPNSLMSGKAMDWNKAFSMHLFHSQSEGITRYKSCGELRDGKDNFAMAIKLAVGNKMGLESLCKSMEDIAYYNPNIQELLDVNKEKYHVKNE